eukprot:gnl/TRDRNA2_/TRDRNA2_107869_c1_seq1.p1 gnl/TRDRNA2_/TRDRNA2_107869_c1~~gnl/TRDRNA2_/TRDRNA2_107869_c1_seq1.p1  ORF type:complete len:552 (+),score=95.30 gnl/TRDRNA2_/TRDRNA2_107869_c1_seq1:60-1658(+)
MTHQEFTRNRHHSISNDFCHYFFGMHAIDEQDVHFCYRALSFWGERQIMLHCLTAGAAVGFYHGEHSQTIFDDMRELRPTFLVGSPCMLRDQLNVLDQLVGGHGALGIDTAVKGSLRQAKRKKVMRDVRRLLGGGELRFLLIQCTPNFCVLPQGTLAFLQEIFGCPILKGLVLACLAGHVACGRCSNDDHEQESGSARALAALDIGCIDSALAQRHDEHDPDQDLELCLRYDVKGDLHVVFLLAADAAREEDEQDKSTRLSEQEASSSTSPTGDWIDTRSSESDCRPLSRSDTATCICGGIAEEVGLQWWTPGLLLRTNVAVRQVGRRVAVLGHGFGYDQLGTPSVGGEVVLCEKLEQLYMVSSSLLRQVWCVSLKGGPLIAVCVCDEEQLWKEEPRGPWQHRPSAPTEDGRVRRSVSAQGMGAGAAGAEGNWLTPKGETVRERLMRKLQETAAWYGFSDAETVQAVLLTTTPFEPENGQASPMGILCRSELLRVYRQQVEALHREACGRVASDGKLDEEMLYSLRAEMGLI